ncbi:hypothetical protein EYZ11_007582 [Aspergillus tanneri]|uniref:Transposase n=1 Tax=Aspergillus tanneri TaxID=1220188 RepID=A0A4S3JCM4_9EURO|nr:hypothetical protein EYZ11_007582 [Aspergillus tanneri]
MPFTDSHATQYLAVRPRKKPPSHTAAQYDVMRLHMRAEIYYAR